MPVRHFLVSAALLLLLLSFLVVAGPRGGLLNRWDPLIRNPTDAAQEPEENGTTWAVLVAGSQGFGNYRHQADICHAYQILRRGGLKDENIVVFMYDDIAGSPFNPRPGVVINHPTGGDVYAGVPKDYTGEHVTAKNLYAVLLGDKSAVKGGSGKVVDSKRNDRIFLYYSDHGGPGVLGMPNMPFLYAGDFIDVLRKKHAAGTYKEMVMYVEACESGSFFQGLMPRDLSVYVTTASNAEESSWGTYCPGLDPSPPSEYITCLGDLYSVAWMEDSETHNLKKETIKGQYQRVKERTSNYNTYNAGSHVMEYGTTTIKAEKLYLFQGFDPTTENFPPNRLQLDACTINQRDADLLFLWQSAFAFFNVSVYGNLQKLRTSAVTRIMMKGKMYGSFKYKKLEDGTEEKAEMFKRISDIKSHRMHLDGTIETIGVLLFGPGNGPSTLNTVREQSLPIVDDWDCLKSMVRLYETHCGSLTEYGMKHMRAFANICNSGVLLSAVELACVAACSGHHSGQWSPSNGGYSA